MPITLDRLETRNNVAQACNNIRIHKKKKQGKSPSQLIRQFRRQNITTSYCSGSVGAGGINRAAMEIGLIEKPKPGQFFTKYSVTKKGDAYGVKSYGRSVQYGEDAVRLLENFFLANTHLNHGFIRV